MRDENRSEENGNESEYQVREPNHAKPQTPALRTPSTSESTLLRKLPRSAFFSSVVRVASERAAGVVKRCKLPTKEFPREREASVLCWDPAGDVGGLAKVNSVGVGEEGVSGSALVGKGVRGGMPWLLLPGRRGPRPLMPGFRGVTNP
jgi:hypothetical protein